MRSPYLTACAGALFALSAHAQDGALTLGGAFDYSSGDYGTTTTTRNAALSAIGRYETVLSDYPDYERIDEVLFRLGQVLSFQGRYAEARPHLARLKSEFPQSPFVPEAEKLEETFPASVPEAPAAVPASAPASAPAPQGQAPATPPSAPTAPKVTPPTTPPPQV